eukprot:11357380-Karenia_brevis.AAC.1
MALLVHLPLGGVIATRAVVVVCCRPGNVTVRSPSLVYLSQLPTALWLQLNGRAMLTGVVCMLSRSLARHIAGASV